MPLADFLKVLDEEVTPHNRPEDVLLIFSGGEVLVRSDLEEAGREVTRRGYAWGMVTNGLALDADRLRSLMDAGLRSIRSVSTALRMLITTSGAIPAVSKRRSTRSG